ncbi:MAG: hypothetical protein VR64_00415 [Desulfatitalea sp. BRH_c12]|nr:MAG: hypothetical protein VR64_00415 [Desulfatitalea sp. BRH_c12]
MTTAILSAYAVVVWEKTDSGTGGSDGGKWYSTDACKWVFQLAQGCDASTFFRPSKTARTL